MRLGEDHDLKRTHVPSGYELREVEEATTNGIGLLCTCVASMSQQACALLLSLGEVIQEVEDTGENE